jgi:hypothetical protein
VIERRAWSLLGDRTTPRRGARRHRATRALAGLCSSFLLASCDSDCQRLCSAWYDYRRDVCQAADTDDDRARCVADYRRGRFTEAEAAACRVRVDAIAAVRQRPASERDACCEWDDAACVGDDDDSAR